MSCFVVRMGTFLLVLSLAGIETAGRCGEPEKKSPPELSDDPFGSGKLKPELPSKAAEHPAAPLEVKTKPSSHHKLHGGEGAILKALKRKGSFEFTCAPLNDVVDFLSEKYHIPIHLDMCGLKDAGICNGTPVTCKLSGISLQSALEIMLDELQLKWTIHHDVLMITSQQKAESDEFMCTKMYNVTDLISPIPDTGTRSNPLALPDNVVSDPTAFMSGQPFGAAEGHTGMPPWPSLPTYTQHSSVGRTAPYVSGWMMDYQPLRDALTNIIEQKSWLDNGGTGTISDMPPGYLIICQTMDVQRQISHFLAELRVRQRAVPAFRVELHWLWLDAAHRDRLLATGRGRMAKNLALTVDSRRLWQIASEVPCFHALATCMSSQTNRMAAGDRRATIINAVPATDGGIGYTPIVTMPNVGVMAAVQPTILPDKKTAMLTVDSQITRWTPSRPPVVIGTAWPAGSRVKVQVSQPAVNGVTNGKTESGDLDNNDPSTPPNPPATTSHTSISSHGAGSASCPIDLPVMPTQEFGTTLRVPLGKPVVVGSVTFAPAGDAGLGAAKENPVEVYLIATTSIVKK